MSSYHLDMQKIYERDCSIMEQPYLLYMSRLAKPGRTWRLFDHRAPEWRENQDYLRILPAGFTPKTLLDTAKLRDSAMDGKFWSTPSGGVISRAGEESARAFTDNNRPHLEFSISTQYVGLPGDLRGIFTDPFVDAVTLFDHNEFVGVPRVDRTPQYAPNPIVVEVTSVPAAVTSNVARPLVHPPPFGTEVHIVGMGDTVWLGTEADHAALKAGKVTILRGGAA